MEEKTAEEIYGLLKQSVVGKSGKIVFSLGETTVDIRTTDIVGSAIQSWLQQWLRDKEIYESTPVNTQEFPDFFLSKSNPESSMLEVKSFNYNASPAFDIANYESYVDSVAAEPNRLDADYLIFGYAMDEYGEITIKEIWLKKIWQIAGKSKNCSLCTQKKRGVIYNIRPNSAFRKDKATAFSNKEEFLKAIYETHKAYRGEEKAEAWLQTLKINYEKYFHSCLQIDN